MSLTSLSLFPFLMVSALTWALALYTLRRHLFPGAQPFGILMIAIGAWAFFYTFELLSDDFPSAIIWINLEYIAILSIPGLWFIFVMSYKKRANWFSRQNIFLLSIMPVVTLILIWTNQYHKLFLGTSSVSHEGELLIIKFSRGPIFWLSTAYNYILLLVSMMLLVFEILRQKQLFRVQRTILLFVLFIPWIANIIYIFIPNSFTKLDLTVFSFALTVVVLAWGLFRFNFLELVPVARDKLMDFIEDAVIVLDPSNLVADLNHKAERLFNKQLEDVLGKPVEEIHTNFPPLGQDILETSSPGEIHRQIILLDEKQEEHVYDLIISLLMGENGRTLGKLIMLRDASDQIKIENILRKSNEDLEQRVLERTAELAASQERYALAERSTYDGIWDWNIIANIVYYSPRWKNMFGYDENELDTDLEAWFSLVHPDDLNQIRTELDTCLSSGKTDFSNEHRLKHKNGSYIWVLVRGMAIFDESGKPIRMVGSFSDITERKHFEEQLLYDSLHDVLTGLSNRALLSDRIERACQRAHRYPDFKFALLYIDLDNFKNINDSLGHSKGDLVLVEIARRLQEYIRSIDTIGRIGGDEFVILLEDVIDTTGVQDVVERVLNALEDSIEIEGRHVSISTSIGIRLNHADDESAEDILRDADIAMYQAKSHGKSCYKIFDISMRDNVLARLELENDLHYALKKQTGAREMLLYYQPIVSLENGKVMGFEALARWKHPKKGIISPNVFIPIAEETGLIVELGEWALREACHQAQTWNITYPSNLLRTMSVNVSARQFSQTDIFLQVKQILLESGLPPQCLKLEITENLLIEDPEAIIRVLEQLRSLGVQVQIDDFGKGYSSLSYLHQLPIDALKIDRSFISRLNESSEDTFDYEVVRTIIALARELKIKVVAEGVEKREQYSLLIDLGCDYIQGFLIAEPMEKTLLEVFLDAVKK